MSRDEIKDLLPDWVGGRLDDVRGSAVARAVEADPDLRREADVLRALAEGRSAVPAGLEAAIQAAVRKDVRAPGAASPTPTAAGRWRVPTWAIGAAAVLAVALGVRPLLERGGGALPEMDALAAVLEDGHTPWIADDGTVAGSPMMDGLSEEALVSLLEELGG